LLTRIATPVLAAAQRAPAQATMPVEAAPNVTDRAEVTHLEALVVLLCGLAPWLELGGNDSAEGKERARLAALARSAIDAGTDPSSPDFMNFSKGANHSSTRRSSRRRCCARRASSGKLESSRAANVITAFKARANQPGETTGNSSRHGGNVPASGAGESVTTRGCSRV